MSLVLIAGMRRSGSTVAFQIAYHMLGDDKKYPLGYTEKPEILNGNGVYIAKTHTFLPHLVDEVAKGNLRVITTYRDPRDIAVSIMNLRQCSFDEVIHGNGIKHAIHEQTCWEEVEGCVHMKYEYWYHDLTKLIFPIATACEEYLTRGMAMALARHLSLERNKERAAKADNIRPDMLFPGHITSGAVGQWKHVLDQDELDQIYDIAGEWMHRHGYKI